MKISCLNLPLIFSDLIGQDAAKKIMSQVSQDLEVLKSSGIKPKLVVGVVGNVPESRIYLDRKKAAALKAGLEFEEKQMSEDVKMPEILETIENLNRDPAVHGIIIQLPIPKHLDEQVFSVEEQIEMVLF